NPWKSPNGWVRFYAAGKSSPCRTTAQPRRSLALLPGPRPAEYMDVQVMHFLAAVVAGVDDDPPAALRVRPASFLDGQPGRERHHAAQQRDVALLDLRHGRDVLLGDHQEVHGRPGIDVVERQHLVVLVDLL